MPIECLTLPEHRLVWLRYWGNLTRTEIFESFEGFRNVPNYDISFDVLQDFRGTETNELTHSDVILLAESINTRRQSLGFSVRIAVLAPGDLGFGMGRMFVTLLGESQFITASAFRELDEAAAFLGISGEACKIIRGATFVASACQALIGRGCFRPVHQGCMVLWYYNQKQTLRPGRLGVSYAGLSELSLHHRRRAAHAHSAETTRPATMLLNFSY